MTGVVMNPPFEQQGDIDHITDAFKFLKPGGRMAAIGGGDGDTGKIRRLRRSKTSSMITG